tara:strand:- start:5028 stop:6758 length:1731 start_codon:yes stop_codon:yes gene_type:complete
MSYNIENYNISNIILIKFIDKLIKIINIDTICNKLDEYKDKLIDNHNKLYKVLKLYNEINKTDKNLDKNLESIFIFLNKLYEYSKLYTEVYKYLKDIISTQTLSDMSSTSSYKDLTKEYIIISKTYNKFVIEDENTKNKFIKQNLNYIINYDYKKEFNKYIDTIHKNFKKNKNTIYLFIQILQKILVENKNNRIICKKINNIIQDTKIDIISEDINFKSSEKNKNFNFKTFGFVSGNEYYSLNDIYNYFFNHTINKKLSISNFDKLLKSKKCTCIIINKYIPNAPINNISNLFNELEYPYYDIKGINDNILEKYNVLLYQDDSSKNSNKWETNIKLYGKKYINSDKFFILDLLKPHLGYRILNNEHIINKCETTISNNKSLSSSQPIFYNYEQIHKFLDYYLGNNSNKKDFIDFYNISQINSIKKNIILSKSNKINIINLEYLIKNISNQLFNNIKNIYKNNINNIIYFIKSNNFDLIVEKVILDYYKKNIYNKYLNIIELKNKNNSFNLYLHYLIQDFIKELKLYLIDNFKYDNLYKYQNNTIYLYNYINNKISIYLIDQLNNETNLFTKILKII